MPFPIIDANATFDDLEVLNFHLMDGLDDLSVERILANAPKLKAIRIGNYGHSHLSREGIELLIASKSLECVQFEQCLDLKDVCLVLELLNHALLQQPNEKD